MKIELIKQLMDGKETYLVSFQSGDKEWGFDLNANSFEEAEQKVADLKSTLMVDGKLVGEIMVKNQETEIIKLDEEQRLVWGWASVSKLNGEPVVDRQGDVIEPRVLEKAATEFMLGARNGLTMHKGEPTTTIVHSMLFTDDVKKAFGIDSPYEGWLIAVKVHCEETWQRVKEGQFKGFSIGGRAIRNEV